MTLPPVTASPTYPYRLAFDIKTAGTTVLQAEIGLDRFPVTLYDYTPDLNAIFAFLEALRTAFTAGGAYDEIDVKLLYSQTAPFPYTVDTNPEFAVLTQTTVISGWVDVYDYLGIGAEE